jgi:hypothetical protein
MQKKLSYDITLHEIMSQYEINWQFIIFIIFNKLLNLLKPSGNFTYHQV